MKELGSRIKSLRKRQGLTIVDVMEKTGIDKATLSRIENGKMEGTVNAHMKIADALGIRLPDLYENAMLDSGEMTQTLPQQKSQTFSHSSGAVAQLLTAGALQKKMMPVLLNLKEGGFTETEEYPESTERFIFILKGSLKIHRGPQNFILKKGDSVYFNAAVPHHFENISKGEASFLSVVTPVSL